MAAFEVPAGLLDAQRGRDDANQAAATAAAMGLEPNITIVFVVDASVASDQQLDDYVDGVRQRLGEQAVLVAT